MNTQVMSLKQRRLIMAVTLIIDLSLFAYRLFPQFREFSTAVFKRDDVTRLSAKDINSAKPITKTPPQPFTENHKNLQAGEGSDIPVDFASPKLAALEKQLTALTQLVENQQQQAETRRQALDAQFNQLQESLASIKNQLLKPVVIKTAAKVTPQAGNQKSAKINNTQITTRKPKILKPPFQLVSLDYWGESVFPLVRYQGKLHSLKMGDSLAHWHFDGMNPSGDGIFVQDSTGKKALLTLNQAPG